MPRAERARLGLLEGGEVELIATPEGLVLEPRREATTVRGDDGLATVSVEDMGVVANETVLEAIRAHRAGADR
jgi:bifunctional DNA-binding transcriptional regulator/antitoxin component of YhaV-PrlF toxin-antitoxin module